MFEKPHNLITTNS